MENLIKKLLQNFSDQEILCKIECLFPKKSVLCKDAKEKGKNRKILYKQNLLDPAIFALDLQASFHAQNLWNKESFAFGLCIGDGYLNKRGILTIQHSLKDKGFLFWKFYMCKRFGFLTEKSRPIRVINVNKRRSSVYISYRFNTRSIFQKEREIFYKNGVKTLPLNILKFYNWQVLALWFMDDGGRGANTPLGFVLDISSFAGQAFSFKNLFFEGFGLETSLHFHNRQKGIIKVYFKKKSVDKFVSNLYPYIIPSLKYKIAKKNENLFFLV